MNDLYNNIIRKRLSRIGLVCVTFGREIDRKDSFAMMDRAHSLDITVFDTAAAHGDGASEATIREWLGRHPEEAGSVIVGCKVLCWRPK